MARPNIQTGDTVREMTEEEYTELLAGGWTPEGDQTPTDSTSNPPPTIAS